MKSVLIRAGGIALKFEWDEDKNRLNFEKHGIDFETAMLVFNDLQRIEIYDMEHSIRLATKTERSIYYDTDSYFG